LLENFTFGVTDPEFNPVCIDADGDSAGPPTLVNPNQCVKLGYSANPDLLPGLIPYDLRRGGSLFGFHGTHNVNQFRDLCARCHYGGPLPVQYRILRGTL